MKKATLNYWVDVTIGVAFLASVVSGLVFLLPAGSAVEPSASILSISYTFWDQLHVWASLGMMAGVLVHLALHRNWVAAMTRKVLGRKTVPQLAAVPVSGPRLTRRRVLSMGCATAFTSVLAAGTALVTGADALRADSAGGSGSALTDAAEESERSRGGVTCRFGIVNDPYPGRCRRYADRGRDGICDYSVPGSGSS
jgi:hypothetical protein